MKYSIYQFLNGKYADYGNTELHTNKKQYKKIVVLGGSFNPPTKAHLMLLRTAVDAVDADCGLFAPAPYRYVQKKMKRSGFRQEIFPDKARLFMLNMMCSGDDRLNVYIQKSDDNPRGYNYEMLEEISSANPESDIYFIIGEDKLNVVSRWHRINEFVEKFKFLVAGRNGGIPEAEMKDNSFFREHADAFEIFSIPKDMADVSSSMFREKLRDENYQEALEVVTDEVGGWIRKNIKVLENSIIQFRDDNDFLSNFYSAPIEYNGLTYENSEAAFQAQKCVTDEERSQFCNLRAGESKRAGRQVSLRSDWEEVKTGYMEDIVREKFTQNPDLAKMLIATGDKTIIEGNTWKDTCWGIDMRTGEGENRLGEILMKVRRELKQNEIYN